MAVIRINKTSNYTIMSNTHFREKEMSLKAKGLLSLMLSLPDTWDYSIAGLVAICKENDTAIKATLKELQRFGYLVITKKMPNETETGRIEYEYDIYEQPCKKQVKEKQGVENLPVENQGEENHSQINTKPVKTKKVNTDYKKDIVEIVSYLNEKAGTKYRAETQATQKLIVARLEDGFIVEDFQTVIDKKCAEWKDDDKMAKYLRPETLFGTKFEGYLNAPAVKGAGQTKKPDGGVDLSDIF